MQIGQFVVPRRGAGIVDDSQEARYMRAWKEELPVDHVSVHSLCVSHRLTTAVVVPDGVL